MWVYCDKAKDGTPTQWASSEHRGLDNVIRRICEAYNAPCQYRRFMVSIAYYDPDGWKPLPRVTIDTRLFIMDPSPTK